MQQEAAVQMNAAEPDSEVKRAPIMISLIIGAFFAILNETILNVAYTDLTIELQVQFSSIQWLSTAFMLMVGILVPISALLIQWFTTRQMFIGAMALFTVGTILSGLAPNFGFLLVGRIIQACGTGLLLPIMMNTILVLYPPHKRGAAMGTVGLVIMFAPALGPTLGGLILEVTHWRWLFFIVVPFAIFSIVFGAMYLKNVTDVTKPKVDVISVILSTLGFGGIVFGFSSVGEGEGGWMHPEVYLSVIIGALSLVFLVLRQLKVEEPMLDVRAFKYPMFSLTTVLLIIMMMSLFSTMIIIPIFLQGPLLLTAFVTGLVLLPGGVINGLLSPVTGKLFDKFGPRVLVIAGTAVLVIVMWFLTRVNPETSVTMFIILHIALMIGLSMIMMPAQTNGLNELPRKLYPHGTAILNTLQQVAGAIGVALFISIMSSRQNHYLEGVSNPQAPHEQIEALIVGVQSSFTVGLGFAILALILALFIKRTEAPKHEA